MDISKYKELLKQREEINSAIDQIEREYTNAKLFQVEAYVITHNGEGLDSIEDVVNYIENRTDLHFKIASQDECNLLWHDDIDINKSNCPIENYKAYFEN